MSFIDFKISLFLVMDHPVIIHHLEEVHQVIILGMKLMPMRIIMKMNITLKLQFGPILHGILITKTPQMIHIPMEMLNIGIKKKALKM